MHPELCWPSNISLRLPGWPLIPATQRILDAGSFGLAQKRKIVRNATGKLHLSPVESKTLYDWIGFRNDRRSTDADITPELEQRARHIVRQHLFWSGKKRFVSKATANNQRYRLLNKIFPDALFVHLVRDGRAVASSITMKKWLPDLYLWWAEEKAVNRLKYYDDPIQLIGEHWLRNVDEIAAARKLYGDDRYIELRYENLVADTHGELDRLLRFMGLSLDQGFFSVVPETLPNMNDKWQGNLTASQITSLDRTIGPKLAELGYT